MANKGQRRHGLLCMECLAGIGDSNLGTSYAAASYLTLIGTARNLSIVRVAATDGDGITGASARFDRDILAWRPGAIYINIGTNDAVAPLAGAWTTSLRAMVQKGVDAGALVTLGTPPIVRNPPGDRPYLADYVNSIRTIAGDTTGCVLFDIYERFLTYNSATLDALYEADGVHLNTVAHTWVRDLANEAANLDCFKIRV
jgi:lysophospholipase L1-like esterase